MSGYAIRVSATARKKLLTMKSASFTKVSKSIELLKTTPYLERSYEPRDDEARLPFDCRVLYTGVYGLYYTVNDSRREMYLRHIVDQRRNPRMRFTDMLDANG